MDSDRELVNKAIDMGWRVDSREGALWLSSPDEEDKTVAYRHVHIPSNLITWVESRSIGDPDISKRKELEAKVKTWFNLEWPTYLTECDGDDDYAREIIVADAQQDLDITEDQAKDWFYSRLS
jgi:hypothetical protein